jgi:hypothetical protein
MENELEIIGTVESLTGKKGKLQFNDANLKREGKRIICNIIDSKGKVAVERCIISMSLSKQLRDQDISLGNLLTLNVATNKEGLHYIIQEAGNWVDVDVAGLTAEAVATEDVNIESLLAYSL